MKNFLTPDQIKTVLDAFEKKIGKKTLLIDLDGVVADFDFTAMIWANKAGMSLKEFKDRELYRQQNFYFELELMAGAKESIMELDALYDITFVSAPSWENPHSFTEKRLWIEKHFGEWATKRMDLSFKKGHYLGHFIIDDRTKYGAGNFIGEHIMFGQEPFSSWKPILSYLKTQA